MPRPGLARANREEPESQPKTSRPLRSKPKSKLSLAFELFPRPLNQSTGYRLTSQYNYSTTAPQSNFRPDAFWPQISGSVSQDFTNRGSVEDRFTRFSQIRRRLTMCSGRELILS